MKASVFVQDVYKITGIGAVPVGKVLSGTLKIGMKLNIDGKIMTLKSIEANHQKLNEAEVGKNIGFALENGDYNLLKKTIKQNITFSDEGSRTRIAEKPEPIHPETTFGFLKKFFRKK